MEEITSNNRATSTPADINRNGRPTSIGNGGRHQSECPADIIGIGSGESVANLNSSNPRDTELGRTSLVRRTVNLPLSSSASEKALKQVAEQDVFVIDIVGHCQFAQADRAPSTPNR
jgi:hypothetical protein